MGKIYIVSIENGGGWARLGDITRRRRSLGDSNRKHTSTTALDVDSRERAPSPHG
jgi:hypothetical protein